MFEYSIVPFNEEEAPFLEFIKGKKFEGYAYPNMPGGTLYKLKLDEETATLLSLKFRLKVFGKSKPEIVIQI